MNLKHTGEDRHQNQFYYEISLVETREKNMFLNLNFHT